MIFEFIQVQRTPMTRHEVKVKNQIIGFAESTKAGHMKLFLNDTFRLGFGELRKMEIFKNEVKCGEITQKQHTTKKILFIEIGYEYYEMLLSGERYLIYETGLGKDKHYFSIYKDDKVIAVIHKPDFVKNFLDRYTCYLEDEKFFLPTVMYCSFLESTAYYNISSEGNVWDNTSTVTTQKELIAKLDMSFIDKVIHNEQMQ